ncbi:hypothetical protein M885DRAFT_521692 [Pelagophyceae sp. CCMP2097]|nr:hypothetical protein M885DRAFT_521692 [Pelagophyceae sp. CCMP2097]|mmetsp:Transcript_32392/g.112040  ORF Transcript_32392/g.112040 Transcript_32392/m.112040 type:complete len:401 (-) Transcript_32392:36-1238(-)
MRSTSHNESEAEIRMHMSFARALADDDPRADMLRGKLSLRTQLRSLAGGTYCMVLLLNVLLLLIATWQWKLFFVVLAELAPTLGPLVFWWSQHAGECPLDSVLAPYLRGLLLLSVAAMGTAALFTAVTTFIFSLIVGLFQLLGPHTWFIGLFLILVYFWGSFCFIEDLWLSSSLRGDRERAKGSALAPKTLALIGSAAGAGYATAQCVLLTIIVAAIMEGHTAFELRGERAVKGEITANETAWLCMLALSFLWFWLPLRLIASHIHALELAKHPDAPVDAGAGCCCHAGLTYTCPLPASDAPQACARMDHLFHTLRWAWLVRTLHFTQTTYGFFIFAQLGGLGLLLWVGCTFVLWGVIVLVARWRVRVLEEALDCGDSSGLRELYGFVRLSGGEDDAAMA